MDIGRIKKELQAHGIKVGVMSRGIYGVLAQQIPDDAMIVAAAEGIASMNKAPVLVTPDRIYIAHYPGTVSMPQVASIARADVTSIEVSGGLLSTLSILTAGGSYTVKKVPGPQAQKVAAGLPMA